MAQNLVVQLLLKTGNFSSDLKQARGQIQNFQQGCKTAGGSLDAFGKSLGINIGSLAKFGSAIGIAAAAGKTLKTVIESNQITSDKFQEAIYASKTAVSSLASAIGTFDFSNFQDGLSGLISRAREAAQEIDQLGNTLMSYNVIAAKANASMAAYRAGQKNPDLSPAELQKLKEKAEADIAELKEATLLAQDDLINTIIAEANAKGAKVSGEGAMQIIDEMVTLDGKKIRDKVKSEMKTVQEEYDKELAKLQSHFQKTTFIGGGNTGFVQPITGPDTKNPEYQKALEELNNQPKYQRLHAFNTLLVKETDESLKHLGEQRAQVYNLEASLSNLETRLETTNARINAGAEAVTKSLGSELKAQEGSLTYWKQIASETEKHRDMEVFNSTAWLTYDKALQDALKHIQELEAKLKRYQYQQNGGGEELTKPENPPTGKAVALNAPGLKMPQTKPESDSTFAWNEVTGAINDTAMAMESLTATFQNGTKVTAASLLKMVSQTLPAVSSLITAIAALSGVEATEKAVATSKHWIEAIAAVAALGAAVAGAISAAKANKYASGGIVPGTSYTGDRVVANVNSGEMILNRAQQANLFKIANGGMGSGREVEFHISGTELVGVLNNFNRKNRVTG